MTKIILFDKIFYNLTIYLYFDFKYTFKKFVF